VVRNASANFSLVEFSAMYFSIQAYYALGSDIRFGFLSSPDNIAEPYLNNQRYSANYVNTSATSFKPVSIDHICPSIPAS